MTLPTSHGLRGALRLNAAFSAATGGLLTALPGTVGDWLDVSIDGWLRLLGLTLIGHAAMLGWASLQPSIGSWAKVNIAVISPYPLIMIGLVVFGAVGSPLGVVLLLTDGVIVGALAFAQWTGLQSRIDGAHPLTA